MLNSRYLHIIKTPYQDKMLAAFRLCQGLKEIDLIWVILKESKSWGEKKEERNLDTLQKRYVRAANTKHASKQTRDYDHTPDFHSPVGATALES